MLQYQISYISIPKDENMYAYIAGVSYADKFSKD
jgi:hypothetical protein